MRASACVRSRGENPKNLLEAMLALRDEPGSGFSDDDVYANIITPLLAGEDTTAYSLAWAMHSLAGDPELQARLRGAALEALGDPRVPMTFADTAKLGLFEGVAFEAMRMRPVAPLNFLEANETTELAGHRDPQGHAGVPADAAGDPRRRQLSGCQGFQAGAMGRSARRQP